MSNAHPGARRYNQTVDDYGALDGAGAECGYKQQCDAASVYAFVWPGSDGVPVHCCPFHVGLYQVNHPRRFRRFVDHAEVADPRDYQRDDRFYQLDDAPERVRAGEFRRLGVDHRGEAHYFGNPRGDGETVTVLRLDRSLDLIDVEAFPRDEIELGDYIRNVERHRGWVATDDEVIAAGREVTADE